MSALGALLAALAIAPLGHPAARAPDPYCTGDYAGARPRAGAPLRFGVDPGLAGSIGGVQQSTVPDDPARDLAAVRALRPPDRVLVVRLNRLFWSGGARLIAQFKATADRYTRAGDEVELQVRYHPGPGQNGDLAAWRAYVRHVVDVFGANPMVVALTITNEVNITFSPNTSDGAYAHAEDALIEGIEAAHAEAVRRGYRWLRFGFTYAYRFSPPADTAFFAYLATHGGRRFRRALGFVGLDFYPGTIYPPVLIGSYRAAMAQALGVLRDCFMPRAGIGRATPIWITENGVPTGATVSAARQASALTQLVDAVRAYSGTFGVTDYRWFNLRDSRSSASGSLPGAAASFATDGLLRSDYTRKPSFFAYRQAIEDFWPAPAGPVRYSRGHGPVPSRTEREGVQMADRLLFIGWGGPVHGREERGLEVFNEAVGMFGRMQQDGDIESLDVVILDASGGSLDGYMELHGSAEQIAALRLREDFRRLIMDAGLVVQGLRMIDGSANEGVAREMAMYQQAISKVPQHT